LGPILFLLYVADLLKLIRRHKLVLHAYAGDIQIYVFCQPSSVNCLADRVSASIDEVSYWMTSNWLQVNPSKTEVLWCSFSRRQHQIPTSPVRIGSTCVLPVTYVRDLGFYIDCDVSLQTRHCHRQIVLRCFTADTQCSAVSLTARFAVAHLCVSRQQGRLLLPSAGRRLPSVVVQAAVHSQRCCSTCILRQAFGAYHSASPRASLAAGSGTDNIPSLCSDTPLPQRSAPAYLAENICLTADVERRRHLRSSTTTTLVIPPVQRSTLGDRAFPVAAPRAWNSVPASLRTVSSLVPFRHQLKTFLFVHSFD